MDLKKFRFAIDRGGTFTDIYAQCPSGKVRTMKLLSVDPSNYSDAPTEGIRRILEEEKGIKIPKNEKIGCSDIEWIRMGTTVATNALLERKGEPMALLITIGFRDMLHIGHQNRPNIFDLKVEMPEVLYKEVVEVPCRVTPELKGKCHLYRSVTRNWSVVKGVTQDTFYVAKPLDKEETRVKLQELIDKGIKSIAVVLIFSYSYQEDEIAVGEIAKELGFTNISLSHQVMPMVRMVNRGYTACADAYLTPVLKSYIKEFACGFENDLEGVNVLFMKSDGGLTPTNEFNGAKAILSGPAGGVIGYATTYKKKSALIGFDMGGTSTDVSRFAGSYEHVFETTVAGITMQVPQLDIITVAAGGGSRLFYRSGMFVVGPESAGAHPGPVCYRKGGYLTITDANVVLGRIQPEYFPKIFGDSENMPLDVQSSILAFEELAKDINEYLKENGRSTLTVQEIACGFIKVANEAMCRPIKNLTEAKGFDTRNHTLVCFGGAGAQHACEIASVLGMKNVVIHKYAGILSAYGLACANVVHEEQEPSSVIYKDENYKYIEQRADELIKKCREKLQSQGFDNDNIETELFLNMRYQGNDGGMMCLPTDSNEKETKFGNFGTTFQERYKSEFGFTMEGRDIIVDDIRVKGIGCSKINKDEVLTKTNKKPSVENVLDVYFENSGFMKTKVYSSKNLTNGHKIEGPALIIDDLSTIVINPSCKAKISQNGNVIIDVGSKHKPIDTTLDMIQLSVFSHRFMSIAEQMGRVLQRTSISTNIKERLDFSCAIFGPDGGLVSNAPHIPVHLGSMESAVRFQIKYSSNIKKGNVILTNHPDAGGTHLPDLTVITPVYYQDLEDPVFFVASRGHHADIGGISPGSMPHNSTKLQEEGVCIKSFLLVKDENFMEEELIEEFMKPGKLPGNSGARNIKDNIADLKAQIAANNKGMKLMQELIEQYSLEVVQAYMIYIQENAETAVRDMLKEIGRKHKENEEDTKVKLSAFDYLDNSLKIDLNVEIDLETGSAIFDFSGTDKYRGSNCNAPKAITYSAIIYCLRCMIGYDIPLNRGCMVPIKVIITKGSILNPMGNAAVVAGNVTTSQRIVDVIFKAFEVVAASQGDMNNITFGQKDWGYYETVAGGAGAGPTWHGRSGVHTHMTNTRITDPEILEMRYPVIIDTFSLIPKTGGPGLFNGGDGCIRRYLFRDKVDLSILTERRNYSPYGMKGGYNGCKGRNAHYREIKGVSLTPHLSLQKILPGDIFEMHTPGGGGWGEPTISHEEILNRYPTNSSAIKFLGRGNIFYPPKSVLNPPYPYPKDYVLP